MFRFRPLLSAGVCALLASSAGRAQDLTVYDDALQNGFQDYSYGGGSVFASTAPVHAGTKSISLTGNGYGTAVSFAHPGGPLTTAQYPTLHFWVHGGASGAPEAALSICSLAAR